MDKTQLTKPLHIAIDGPVAAGKGTIAKRLAQELGFLYVDTGAMYRCSAVIALENNLSMEEEERIAGATDEADIEMYDRRNLETGEITTVVELNGADVTERIRLREIDRLVPKVAAMAKVRAVLVKKQQKIAVGKDVIMEGRDISSVVLPNADLKIFLTADVEERTRRRLLQYRERGNGMISYEEVKAELESRDEMDLNRKSDPLRQVTGAWLLDTTNIGIEEAAQMIAVKLKSMLK
ncbi:(d)CMP kinase [Microgenomates group bacterium]|nr:(d)CMP kinase [Microgenomates group bacterium]